MVALASPGLVEALGEVIDAAIELAGADFGDIQLVDAEGRLKIVVHRNLPDWWIRYWDAASPGQGVCGTALGQGRRVIVQDVERDPIFAGTPALEVQLRAGIRAVQSTPLHSSSGACLGMLSTHYRAPQPPIADKLKLLSLLARHAATLVERARDERSLRESEDRFRALMQASSDVVYRMSPDWTAVHYLVGRDFIADTEGPSRTWPQRYIHPEDRPRVTAAIQEAIRRKGVFELEHRVLRVDGSLGWTYSRAVPILDSVGEIVEWFGTASDITDRKESESERERLLGEVQAERDRMTALVASMRDEVWFADTQRRFALANPAALKEFGLVADETIDVEKLAASREVLRPDGSPRPVEEAPPLRALRGETVCNEEEIIRTPASGELRYREVNATPVRDAAGQILGSVAVVRDISDRKAAGAERERLLRAIQAERDLLQAVMNSAGKAHLVYLDRDFNFVRVNETYAATCGYRPEEMIGRNHFALYPHPENEAIFRRVRDTGEAFEVHDKPFEFPDEPERGVTYWDWTLIPVKDAGGRVTGLIFSLFETTARVRAEAALKTLAESLEEQVAKRTAELREEIQQRAEADAALRASEARLRTVFDCAPIGIVQADPTDGRLLTVNPAYCAVVGYSADELIGQPIGDFTHPQDREADRQGLRQLAAREIDVYAREKRYIRKDGSVVWVGVTVSLVRDSDGRPLLTVAMIADIDERKRLEADLAERTDSLLKEKESAQRYLDTVQSIVIALDMEGRVTMINRAGCALLGVREGELIGRNWFATCLPQPEGTERVYPVFRQIVGGDLRSVEYHENTIRRKDGSERLIAWHNTYLQDESGKIVGTLSSGEDVTDLRHVEAEAREHLEEAARLQRLQTVNELATLLAHELNQPLAAVATYAEAGRQLLRKPSPDLEKLAVTLDSIGRQALRAGDIIRHLRSFVGQRRIDPVPMDLNETVLSACDLMAPKGRRSGIRLETSLDPRLPPVVGVDVQVEQVLLNLLRNAFEAIGASGIEDGWVTVSTRRSGDRARVTVDDSGPGIDAEIAAKLFQPLSSRKIGGLGVGLRISRGLIEAQGGRLWAEPKTPGGVFHFELPLET